MAGKTLYDKIWDSHLVKQRDDGTALIYIDRQLIHEVTSPQAFDGLRLAGRKPWRAAARVCSGNYNWQSTPLHRKNVSGQFAALHSATSSFDSSLGLFGVSCYLFLSCATGHCSQSLASFEDLGSHPAQLVLL